MSRAGAIDGGYNTRRKSGEVRRGRPTNDIRVLRRIEKAEKAERIKQMKQVLLVNYPYK